MYDLKRVSENEWSFSRDKKTPFVGTLLQVCEVAKAMGFELEHIEEGIDEMSWMDHDGVHFGIKRRFIFTYDTKSQTA